MSEKDAPVLGIDLGTTNSVVAVLDGTGRPEVVRNAQGQNTTPSVVYFRGSSVLVGAAAKQQRVLSGPLDVVENVKRHMGNPAWRHVTSTEEDHTPEQISAFILRKLREDASRALGVEATRAVITVPAYFDDPRRQATRDAGEIAGLDVVNIISEPTAAALAYGLRDADAGTVLVYDLGGGTFDVTVLRIADGSFDVIATSGDRELGGVNFDERLMNWVNDQVEAVGAEDLHESEDLRVLGLLREQCEVAKHTLSNLEDTEIFIDTSVGARAFTVTRAVFEELTEDLLQRTADIVEEVMEVAREKAGISMADLDHVLLVGGSTRMPMVRRMLTGLTGIEPSESLHPDEAVALGAAVQGELVDARATGRTSTVGDREVSDVTAHGLGVISLDRETGRFVNNVILPAQSKIPGQRSELFETVDDDQTVIMARVTLGDDTDPDYVEIITRDKEGMPIRIPPHPKGSPIRVTISYDVDGIVQVEVFDLVADRSLGMVEIERELNLPRADVELMSAELARKQVR
ncbi:Hsp70 family protein [Thermobifida halotolerans]|uniref:Hsp70 family protein n=1 Tax=Thermobifida halotolerans TaxID=483545 RepID=A0A399FZ31_9ACTN|nr:Hsp70 family protein [Thermobifida halotolerans]UOE18910.1 Hsp70 family protein [Thermobifida halotolerans]